MNAHLKIYAFSVGAGEKSSLIEHKTQSEISGKLKVDCSRLKDAGCRLLVGWLLGLKVLDSWFLLLVGWVEGRRLKVEGQINR